MRKQYWESEISWPISGDSDIRMTKAAALDLTLTTLLQMANQAYNEVGQFDLRTESAPELESLDLLLSMITRKTNAEMAIQELNELTELFEAVDSVSFHFEERYMVAENWYESERYKFK